MIGTDLKWISFAVIFLKGFNKETNKRNDMFGLQQKIKKLKQKSDEDRI